MKQNGLA